MVYRCRNEKGWPIAEIRGAVEELTGYTAAELEDGGFEERLVHPDDQEAVWREVQAALADGEPFELTYRILTKDGTTRWVWERGQRVAREHRDEDVLEGFITDITERKADERELERQIERLERFASVVSHDLRNPLNVAHGRIELEREANASEHLDAAQEAVERGLDLVHDLLALAREGEQVQEAGPVALSGALERCWQNVETDDATLAVETERTIRADPTRVEQLLENLLRNAVRHGGSDVTVTLGDLPDGFYIEDDGPGIAEPAREKIFQMGYSTDDEGTGFGLNIVREIVAAHGWEIAATDSATGGARFEITGVQDAR
ncbi:MAG: sensor histidine kinase [Haloarculaceae archaeon]